MNKRSLKNLIALSCNIKIYVPSTIESNQDFDSSKLVNHTLAFLSNIFGGATSYNALGCWFSTNHGLIKEKIFICESFCTSEKLDENIEKVIDYCETLKNQLKQESIALEINNSLHLV